LVVPEVKQQKERAWGGYAVHLRQEADGWYYAVRPQALGTGAVAGPAEQLPVGPFATEDEAFEDAKTRTMNLQRDRPAGI
jgi:hypothetical protein